MNEKPSAETVEREGRYGLFQGMRGNLLVWFVLLALIPMILIGVISFYSAQKALTQNILVSFKRSGIFILVFIFGMEVGRMGRKEQESFQCENGRPSRSSEHRELFCVM